MPRERKPTTLRTIDLTALAAEMTRRQAQLPALRAREAELAAEVASLAAAIQILGGTTAARRRVGRGIGRVARVVGPIASRTRTMRTMRTKNDTNLSDALAKVLTGKTMSVTDAAEAVKKAGYKSSSSNFRTMVNIALLNKKKFKRVERGMYTAA